MIQNDSRKVKPGDIFVAIKGIVNDGHDYIDEAIKNGASKIISQRGKNKVKDTKKYLSNYLKKHYYHQIKHLKLIGITGTNGKTTTAFLIYQALNKLDIKCAYIGTLGFYINDTHKKLSNTTPDILELYKLLMKAKDCKYVVLEVSSQGLAYGRVDTLLFDYAIFTNLTQDHLDYHKTMENYCLAKQKLFKQLKKNGLGIVNIDDEYSTYFKTNNTITYGVNSKDYKIGKYNIDKKGTTFILNDKEYYSKLIGKHNIYNLTIVIIILEKLGIDNNQIRSIIKQLNHVDGRMDTINYQDNLIIIDYAHTPDALKKIINSVKDFGNNIITIIGCGGNRDKEKRPIMGKIAVKYSDYVIFTSDNPRLEDPSRILSDITSKLDTKNYEIEENRQKSIEKGIQRLEKNDILLILGKGCEDYQIIGTQKYHFNDKEEVLKIIGR